MNALKKEVPAIENRWEHFRHGADIGIRGIGAAKSEAFEQAGLALTAAVADLESVGDDRETTIALQAPDDEILFVDWLNALIYEMATQRSLFARFEVTLDGNALRARVWGERIDTAKHQPGLEVKGATFTELKVASSPEGLWTAQCVVDV